jgi:hypothetical protein
MIESEQSKGIPIEKVKKKLNIEWVIELKFYLPLLNL